MTSWHKLESLQRREPQLRKCFLNIRHPSFPLPSQALSTSLGPSSLTYLPRQVILFPRCSMSESLSVPKILGLLILYSYLSLHHWTQGGHKLISNYKINQWWKELAKKKKKRKDSKMGSFRSMLPFCGNLFSWATRPQAPTHFSPPSPERQQDKSSKWTSQLPKEATTSAVTI